MYLDVIQEYPTVMVIYLLGTVDDMMEQVLLEREQEKYCDLLQFHLRDSYYNATLKTQFAIQYFYKNDWDPTHGPPAYFLRGDDDIFFNIPKFYSFAFYGFLEIKKKLC